MGVDGHRYLNVAVADDVSDDVRRDAEVEQQGDAGVADARGWRTARKTLTSGCRSGVSRQMLVAISRSANRQSRSVVS
jgi:hypothetical protein